VCVCVCLCLSVCVPSCNFFLFILYPFYNWSFRRYPLSLSNKTEMNRKFKLNYCY
jgi:hypothetical protein